MVQGKNSFAVQFYSESLLACWGVGFLRYFQLKQFPNFLLAFPILSLAVCSIIYYAKLRKEVFLSLGFRASPVDKKSAAVFFSVGTESRSKIESVLEKETTKIREEDCVLRRRKQNIKGEDPATLSLDNDSTHNKQGYLSVIVLPFLLNLGFMSATAFFVMHVQVSTRFLLSSPPLYIIPSSKSKIWGYLIWAYCAAYILLSSTLFSNFYPFT
ncbi:hypothetical protein LguiA_007245 [Lonicera macranthoides]